MERTGTSRPSPRRDEPDLVDAHWARRKCPLPAVLGWGRRWQAAVRRRDCHAAVALARRCSDPRRRICTVSGRLDGHDDRRGGRHDNDVDSRRAMGSSRSRVVARNGGDHRVRLATPITTPSSVPDPLRNRQSEPDRPSQETHPALRSRRRRGEAADASCNDVRYHSAKGAGECPECAGRSRSREQARVLVAAEAPLPNGGDVARRLSRTPTSGRRTGPCLEHPVSGAGAHRTRTTRQSDNCCQ